MSPPTTPDFRRLLRDARERRRFSQRDAAARIGCNPSYISQLEDPRSSAFPSRERIRDLARLFDLNEEELRSAVAVAHETHLNKRLLARAARDAERFTKQYAHVVN